MNTCWKCNHENYEGTLTCKACGDTLIPTQMLNRSRRNASHSADTIAAKAPWERVEFSQNCFPALHINTASKPILLHPGKRTTLGRSDKDTAERPDLDLTLYGAVAKGVSRIHAAIYGSESALNVVDLDSRNGTYLNGRRLTPHVPHILRDGDQIRLGKLIMSLHF